jgi:two-component system response regulator FixJ
MMSSTPDLTSTRASSSRMDTTPLVHIVDDDDAMCRMLARTIEGAGLKTMTHASAETFLATYNPDTPGCLILDLRMGGMSGVDLQRTLADRHLHIPTIIITGHGDVRLAVETMRLGAIDFIEKPFREQVLLDCVREALARDAKERSAHASRAALQSRLALLTEQQREVLNRLVLGMPEDQIASDLSLTLEGVAQHTTDILARMQMHSTIELVYQMYATRLLEVPDQGDL